MSIGNRGLVAITGANGTIGYACTLYALRHEYRVRCIVRSEAAVMVLKAGPSLQQFSNQLEYAIVPDNTLSGSYDAALTGARYVIHVAGVWPTPDKHPDNDIYYPFVTSMETILSAAERSGTIKRVVFTQAGAAFVNPDDGDTLGTTMDEVLDESMSVESRLLSLKPPMASVHHAYCAAKAMCMTSLKQIILSKNASFSVVQVVPGTVMGSSELVSTAPEAKRKMDRMSRALLFNDLKPRYLFGFVHVDDCARVHVESLDESKVPDGELPDWFIAAAPTQKGKNGQDTWKEAGDLVEGAFENEIASGMFTVGRDNMPMNMPYCVDSKFTEAKLLGGNKFRSLNDCIEEVGNWYRGLVVEQ